MIARNNSCTIKTCNVDGSVIFVFVVVAVNLARKVRPVTKCGCKTKGVPQVFHIIALADVATAIVAAAN